MLSKFNSQRIFNQIYSLNAIVQVLLNVQYTCIYFKPGNDNINKEPPSLCNIIKNILIPSNFNQSKERIHHFAREYGMYCKILP